MRIQHNIAALNTHRNLNSNNTNASKALEKLSSGYKINRAGDDAAGLAISEKMRGLNMASKNAQDGISLIQTAEGALNEVHAMLQRGRELAVQAANDTNVDPDREALQKEVSQLMTEINETAKRTEFNTLKVLKGGADSTANISNATTSATALSNRLVNSMLGNAEQAVTSAYGLTPDKVSIDVSYVNEAPGGRVAWVTSQISPTPSKPTALTLDEADFLTGSSMWIDNDRIVTHEMAHAVMSAAIDDFGALPDWFTEGTAEYVAGGNERVRGSGNISDLITNKFGSITDSDGYAASFLATKYLDDKLKAAGSGIATFMQDLQGGMTLDDALQNRLGMNTTAFEADFRANGAAYFAGNTFFGTGSILDPTGMKSDSNLIADDEATPSLFTYTWDASTGYLAASPKAFTLQIGANEGQTLTMSLPNISTGNLGITGVSVTSQSMATSTITRFDEAITKVADARSTLGAIQNRLEHTINNLGAAAENLTSAESRIRDTDMAKEMMNFTKQNILMEAAQSMLSQANQQPQVLQLLG